MSELYERLFQLACADDLDGVLGRMLELLIEETRAERGFLVVVRGRQLDVRAARGVSRDGLADESLSPSRSVVREAVRTRAAVRLARASNDTVWAERASISGPGLQSILAVPVISEGRVVAVVCVDSTRPDAFDAALEAGVGRLAEPLGAIFQGVSRAGRLRRQEQALRAHLGGWAEGEGPALLGQSPAFLASLEQVRRAAAADVPLLLLGETGTGKELLAGEAHRRSARAGRPFVAVNCAALPEPLLEAELFGHTAGAFTGASESRLGRFAAADGGTLFLDEVGELGPAAQARFLRALESGEVQRVGDDRAQRVNVRVIAATHQDLSGPGFRRDLYYRLAVVPVRVPALRERGADVSLLAQAFCLEAALAQRRPVEGISAAALRLLEAHPWPGNVRELRNAMQRATLFATGTQLEPGDLPPEVRGQVESGPPTLATLGTEELPATWEELLSLKQELGLRLEAAFARATLERSRGNVARAAREAGLSRAAFYELLGRAGVDPASFR